MIKMPKHKNKLNKQRKKYCPICLSKSWNNCKICSNDECKYSFFSNRKNKQIKKKLINKHVKKNLIYKFNKFPKIKISYKIFEDIDMNLSHEIGITNTKFLDIDYNWIKN